MLFGRLRDRLLRGGGVCFEAGEGEGDCMCLGGGWRCWRRRRLGKRGWEGDCLVWVRVGGLLLKWRFVSLLLCLQYLGDAEEKGRRHRQ